MYSRDFGGIKSDGQLYNMEREYNESRRYDTQREYNESHREEDFVRESEQKSLSHEKSKSISLDFLRNLKLDDLILIGIGILLLLDSDGENDLFAIIIAIMLMF